MTIQRITNLHSAPISACLRAFVLAVETGKLSNSQSSLRPYSNTSVRRKLGMNSSNLFKGGNACVTGFTQGNSAILRGSA